MTENKEFKGLIPHIETEGRTVNSIEEAFQNKSMTQENRLLNEIEKVVRENLSEFREDELEDLLQGLYSLHDEVSNEYYNTMKVNKEEFGTTARFNHWAINHFKK